MNRRALLSLAIAIPAFAALPALVSADSIAPTPAEVVYVGTHDATGITLRMTNPTREELSVSMPRLVMISRGIRIPVRVTEVVVNGRAQPLGEEIELSPGATVTVRVVHEAVTDSGPAELSFRGGDYVAPYRFTR